MKIIVNKTRRPLTIKLGRGRVLRLGPSKEGQIATPDADSGSIQKLIAAGEVEIFDDVSRAGSVARGGALERSGATGEHRRFSGSKHGDR